MDALFIVPVLVSPEVNERLVLPLTKLIERNIILNNATTFRDALIHKNQFITKAIKAVTFSDSDINNQEYTEEDRQFTESAIEKFLEANGGFTPNSPNTNLPPNSYQGGKNNQNQPKENASPIDYTQLAGIIRKGQWDRLSAVAKKRITDTLTKERVQIDQGKDQIAKAGRDDVTKVEFPGGITFFAQISVEPTILTVPIVTKSGFLSNVEQNVVASIGVKCVPYKIKNITNVLNYVNAVGKDTTISGKIGRMFSRMKKNIPFSKWRGIWKGDKMGDVNDLIFTPSAQYLANPRRLALMMSASGPSPWTTMLLLSTNDFDKMKNEDGTQKAMDMYSNLASNGFGDIVIVNDVKESAYFCIQRWRSCMEFPFTYLKQILNVSNVLDYSELSRWSSRPVASRNIKSVFNESMGIVDEPSKKDYVDGYINKTLNS